MSFSLSHIYRIVFPGTVFSWKVIFFPSVMWKYHGPLSWPLKFLIRTLLLGDLELPYMTFFHAIAALRFLCVGLIIVFCGIDVIELNMAGDLWSFCMWIFVSFYIFGKCCVILSSNKISNPLAISHPSWNSISLKVSHLSQCSHKLSSFLFNLFSYFSPLSICYSRLSYNSLYFFHLNYSAVHPITFLVFQL